MSYRKLATELHTIEEIELALENAYMKGYSEAEQNWWKQQDEEESREAKKFRNNDRESILVDDTKSSKTVDDEMEAKK